MESGSTQCQPGENQNQLKKLTPAKPSKAADAKRASKRESEADHFQEKVHAFMSDMRSDIFRNGIPIDGDPTTTSHELYGDDL